MKYDPVAELRNLTTCRCEPAWTERKLHAPNCLEEYREDVETLIAERNWFRDHYPTDHRLDYCVCGESWTENHDRRTL